MGRLRSGLRRGTVAETPSCLKRGGRCIFLSGRDEVLIGLEERGPCDFYTLAEYIGKLPSIVKSDLLHFEKQGVIQRRYSPYEEMRSGKSLNIAK